VCASGDSSLSMLQALLLLLWHRIGISPTTVTALQPLSSPSNPHARFRQLKGSCATTLETQLVGITKWKGLLDALASFGPFH